MKTWLAGVNPLVDFALSDGGDLTFANAAVDAGAGAGSRRVPRRVVELRQPDPRDRSRSARRPGPVTRLRAPAGLPSAPNAYIKVEIAATGGPQASWKIPVRVFFTRTGQAWKLVGVERGE